MISEINYIPIGLAMKEWCEHFEKKFFKDWLIEKRKTSQVENASDKYVEYSDDDIFVEYMNINRIDNKKLFLSNLGKINIYLQKDGVTFSAASDILEKIHAASFEYVFWPSSLGPSGINRLEIETIKKWLTLPRICGDIYCFVDPYTWTIDHRAYVIARERVEQAIDPLKFRVLKDSHDNQALCEDLDEVDDIGPEGEPFETTFSMAQRFLDESNIVTEESSILPELDELQIEYFSDHLFLVTEHIQLKGLQDFGGAALCLKRSDWVQMLKEFGNLTYENVRSFSEANEKKPKKRGPKATGAKSEFYHRYPDGVPDGLSHEAIAAEISEAGFTISARSIGNYEKNRTNSK